MRKDELINQITELDKEYRNKKKQAIRQFCDANNPYKAGDVFTDHIGSIMIEQVGYEYPHNPIEETPQCVYLGIELKKDRTPKKNNSRRMAWQYNDVLLNPTNTNQKKHDKRKHF